MDPQNIQVVMQLTEAQKREEIAVAKMAAEQAALEARKAAVKPLLMAIYEADEAAGDEGRRAQGHYSYEVLFEDKTWVFTFESTSCRVLRGLNPELTLQLRDEELPAGRFSGVCVTDLVRRRENVLDFVRAVANANDYDVGRMSKHVLTLGNFSVKWPVGVEPATIMDLYLLLLEESEQSKMMIDTKTGECFVPKHVAYVPPNPMRGQPEMVSFHRGVTVSQGGKVADALIRDAIWQPKLTGATLPVRVATEEEIQAGLTRGTELHKKLCGDTGNGIAHMKYEGMGYTPGPWGMKIPHVINGRVVVDPEGCRLADPGTMNSLFSLSGVSIVDSDDDYDDDLIDAKVTEVTDDQRLATMSTAIVLFNLDRGMWMLGDASKLSTIKFREDAFEQLVLDHQRKRLVEALVVHTNDGDGVDVDIIDGKGGGAIFLLDGPPGTGKTLTAEATAEKLKRTLYKVGQGELGTNASHLEKKLNAILNMARRWNAVLLIDEADVFLEKRSTENLERNAMVAVFLRLLEYYNGILFLTTNRGDNFDPAVISRISLALHFTRPTEIGRATIWTNLLKNAGVSVTTAEAANLAQLDINGREIKNAINNSRALAKSDGTAVTYAHIREIVDSSMLFAEEVKRPQAELDEPAMVKRLVGALMEFIRK